MQEYAQYAQYAQIRTSKQENPIIRKVHVYKQSSLQVCAAVYSCIQLFKAVYMCLKQFKDV